MRQKFQVPLNSPSGTRFSAGGLPPKKREVSAGSVLTVSARGTPLRRALRSEGARPASASPPKVQKHLAVPLRAGNAAFRLAEDFVPGFTGERRDPVDRFTA